MIESSLNEILQRRIQVAGYRIYAIYDGQNRCLYVGCTNNLRSRIRQHFRVESELREYLAEGENPRIEIYDRDDVDQVVLSRESSGRPREFSSEREWALAAEWYMCYVLRPYINHRKTYKPEIDAAIKLYQYGTFSPEEAYLSVMKILRDWNVTARRLSEEEKSIKNRLGL